MVRYFKNYDWAVGWNSQGPGATSAATSLFGTEQTAQLHEFHLSPCQNSMAATA